jgi:filamentous hemagglutinin family protein
MKLKLSTQIKLQALAVAGAFGATAGVLANPSGGVVVNGTATIVNSGPLTTVTNSNGAVINWQSFSIGANETTRFVQPDATSAVLNRVVGADPSSILGQLQSNGKVFLINPNGIVFGQGARIDVAGLVASTANISNADFQANRLRFEGSLNQGNVTNAGAIRAADGGQVLLIGKNVSNTGSIDTPNGSTQLVAGRSVELISTATPGVRIAMQDGGNVENLGVINGRNIDLAGAMLRNKGIINADQVSRDAQGRIVLQASRNISIESGSRISANNTQGNGGTILIGGGWQGGDRDVFNANGSTVVEQGALIQANGGTAAGQRGNGGTVVVWNDRDTLYNGLIEARGGNAGGNGGMVETSGKVNLGVQVGNVDTRAPNGKRGLWLLDPTDINIVASGATGSDINASVLNNALSNQTLTASNDINFNANVQMVNSGIGITAYAGNSVNVNADLKTTGGDISLFAQQVKITGANVDSTGGAININATGAVGSSPRAPVSIINSTVSSGSGALNISAGLSVSTMNNSAVEIFNSVVSSTTGAINITGTTTIALSAPPFPASHGVRISGNSTVTSANDITIQGNVSGGNLLEVVGVDIENSTVSGTGVTSSININGLATGANSSSTYGVALDGANISSTNIVYVGGTASGAGSGQSVGVGMANGAQVSGDTVNLIGTANGGATPSFGFLMNSGAVTGPYINISGNSTDSGGSTNAGVKLAGGSITQSGTGGLSIEGAVGSLASKAVRSNGTTINAADGSIIANSVDFTSSGNLNGRILIKPLSSGTVSVGSTGTGLVIDPSQLFSKVNGHLLLGDDFTTTDLTVTSSFTTPPNITKLTLLADGNITQQTGTSIGAPHLAAYSANGDVQLTESGNLISKISAASGSASGLVLIDSALSLRAVDDANLQAVFGVPTAVRGQSISLASAQSIGIEGTVRADPSNGQLSLQATNGSITQSGAGMIDAQSPSSPSTFSARTGINLSNPSNKINAFSFCNGGLAPSCTPLLGASGDVSINAGANVGNIVVGPSTTHTGNINLHTSAPSSSLILNGLAAGGGIAVSHNTTASTEGITVNGVITAGPGASISMAGLGMSHVTLGGGANIGTSGGGVFVSTQDNFISAASGIFSSGGSVNLSAGFVSNPGAAVTMTTAAVINTGGGAFSATSASVGGVSILGSVSTVGGSAFLSAPVSGNVSVAGNLTTGGGNVVVVSGNLPSVGGTINAGTGTVLFESADPNQTISINGAGQNYGALLNAVTAGQVQLGTVGHTGLIEVGAGSMNKSLVIANSGTTAFTGNFNVTGNLTVASLGGDVDVGSPTATSSTVVQANNVVIFGANNVTVAGGSSVGSNAMLRATAPAGIVDITTTDSGKVELLPGSALGTSASIVANGELTIECPSCDPSMLPILPAGTPPGTATGLIGNPVTLIIRQNLDALEDVINQTVAGTNRATNNASGTSDDDDALNTGNTGTGGNQRGSNTNNNNADDDDGTTFGSAVQGGRRGSRVSVSSCS